jgi:hypothetical protein
MGVWGLIPVRVDACEISIPGASLRTISWVLDLEKSRLGIMQYRILIQMRVIYNLEIIMIGWQ